MTIHFFRLRDADDRLAEVPGLNKFAASLKALEGTVIEEHEGALDELWLLAEKEIVLLVLPPEKMKLLGLQPERIRRSVFLIGCDFSITEKMDSWQVAGVLPDLDFRHTDAGYLAFGHKSIVNLLVPGIPALVQHHALFSLAKDGQPAALLPEYLRLYKQSRQLLWPAMAMRSREPVDEENTTKKNPRDKKPYGQDNSWYEKLKETAAGTKNNGKQEQPAEFRPEENTADPEKHLREQEEAELRMRSILREAVFDKTFRDRGSIRELVLKQDRTALLRQLYRQLAISYCTGKYIRSGWPDPKVWTDVRFLQRVGKDKSYLPPEEVGDRKLVSLENGTSWAELARVDIMLTKTVLNRLDPEVLFMLQSSPEAEPAAAQQVLSDVVRPLLRKMSSGNATVRILTRAGKLDGLNASFWGNEKQVTLALEAGSEGWADQLPFSKQEVAEMLEELLKTVTT